MTDSWFVNAVTVRIPVLEEEEALPEAQWSAWLEVKSELAYGELKRLQTASFTSMQVDATTEMRSFGVDMSAYEIARILTYVTDWNLKGPNGKDMPFSRASLLNLRADKAELIKLALDRHVARVESGNALTAGDQVIDTSYSVS